MTIAGVELPVIGLDDFRTNKRASGRAKDLADLESLDDSASSGRNEIERFDRWDAKKPVVADRSAIFLTCAFSVATVKNAF